TRYDGRPCLDYAAGATLNEPRESLLLGSVYVELAGGVVSSNQKRHVCNYYNRVAQRLSVVEGTGSWTYTVGYRLANASGTNFVSYVQTMRQDKVEATVMGIVAENGTQPNRTIAVGIGIDSSTVNSAVLKGSNALAGTSVAGQVFGKWSDQTTLGMHNLWWLETAGGTGGVT